MMWTIDALLCLMLAGAMVVGTRLWRKIDVMRASQGELKELLKQLGAATERANTAVVQLRATIKEADARLGDRLVRARALSDELSVMTESGDRLAGRLADSLADRGTRTRTAVKRVREESPSPSPAEADALAKILQGLR